MSIQRRNPELVSLLRADFLHLTDPARTITSTANVSDPPTTAELNSAFDTPANLPDGFIGLINDNDADTDIWIAVVISSAWYTVKLGNSGGTPMRITSPLTPFGEVQVASKYPEIQLDFVYNINTRLTNKTEVASGTVTQANAMAVVSSGAATSSSATLSSRRIVKYHPGQGVTVRFTALFGTPTSGNQQLVGVGDSENGLFFGTDASGNFGIIRRSNSVDTFVNKTAWNIDKLDGNIDPMTLTTSNLNVYEIGFQFLGAGAITFRVEGDADSNDPGQFIDVHRIDYTNDNTEPTLYNPSFPMMIESKNTTNNTAIVVKSASMSAFIDGEDRILGESFSATSSISSVTTETSILTLHSKTSFASKTNHSRARLGFISISTSGAKLTTVNVYHQATPSGVTYNDVDTNTSFMEFSTTQSTTINGGHIIATLHLGTDDSKIIDLADYEEYLYPDETLLFSGTSSGSGSDVAVSMRWEEDI